MARLYDQCPVQFHLDLYSRIWRHHGRDRDPQGVTHPVDLDPGSVQADHAPGYVPLQLGVLVLVEADTLHSGHQLVRNPANSFELVLESRTAFYGQESGYVSYSQGLCLLYCTAVYLDTSATFKDYVYCTVLQCT